MQKYTVYVDGQAGTTGLKINERLTNHPYVEIMKIDEAKRKDLDERKKMINSADIVFLCLPDAAAIEAVSLVDPSNTHTKILDASTAHRTSPEWTYGIPELSKEARAKIAVSNRTAVPGCYASSFILPLYPLVQSGMIPKDFPITSYGISGYSGAGKTAIADYTDPNIATNHPTYLAPRPYALNLSHKHIPEMQKIVGLDYAPIFSPIVNNYYKGLAVATSIHTRLLPKKYTPKDFHEYLTEYYKDEYFVKVMPFNTAECDNHELGDKFFSPLACNDTNFAEIFVYGNDEQILLLTRLDNLGKGASGAAIQNMNIMLGLDEKLALE